MRRWVHGRNRQVITHCVNIQLSQALAADVHLNVAIRPGHPSMLLPGSTPEAEARLW